MIASQQSMSSLSLLQTQFAEGVSAVLMAVEELRRSLLSSSSPGAHQQKQCSSPYPQQTIPKNSIIVQIDQVMEWQQNLETILEWMIRLVRYVLDITSGIAAPSGESEQNQDRFAIKLNNHHHHPASEGRSSSREPAIVELDLYQHCYQKAVEIAQQILQYSIENVQELINDEEVSVGDNANDGNSANTIPLDVIRQDVQTTMARIVEINLLLLLQHHPTCILQPSYSSSTSSSSLQQRHHQQQQQQLKNDSINKNENDNNNHHTDEIMSSTDIIECYVRYQRLVLRQRVKPALARLVQNRQQQQQQVNHQQGSTSTLMLNRPSYSGTIGNSHKGHIEENLNGTNRSVLDLQQQQQSPQQQHVPVIAMIAGQAAALIHPLIMWKSNLPINQQQQEGEEAAATTTEGDPMTTAIRTLCRDTITTLDDQTQTLIQTVANWFYEDQQVDSMWMHYSSEYMHQDELLYSHDFQLQQYAMSILDPLVEEMAIGCQILMRYVNMIQDEPNIQTLVSQEIIPELIQKYATLEHFLCHQQWLSALQAAIPIPIVLGTHIHVPSIVEDAQYIGTRALERAASTYSFQAMGNVAHVLSEHIWSSTTMMTTTNNSMGMNHRSTGIYQALLDQRGCWLEPTNMDPTMIHDSSNKMTGTITTTNSNNLSSSPGKKNSFASALLDALDEDMGSTGIKSGNNTTTTLSPPLSGNFRASGGGVAPSSGGFLSNLLLVGADSKIEQMQLDGQFCLLNGIHAAIGACHSLATFIDALLTDQTNISSTSASHSATDQRAAAMLELTRDELKQYAYSYQSLLHTQVMDIVIVRCGSGLMDDINQRNRKRDLPLNHIRWFIEQENYQLDSQNFGEAESDERLERVLVGPLKQSKFLGMISDKCDMEVLNQLGEHLATCVVNIILSTIWDNKKQFTDWGALLLSKQVRLIQALLARVTCPSGTDEPVVQSIALVQIWERLSQVLAVLQLEKPADWLAYHPTSILSQNDLSMTMCLRIDFLPEAIQSVISAIAKHSKNDENSNSL